MSTDPKHPRDAGMPEPTAIHSAGGTAMPTDDIDAVDVDPVGTNTADLDTADLDTADLDTADIDTADIDAVDFAVGLSDLDDEAAPAVRAARPSRPRGARRASHLRRKLAGAFVVMIGLAVMGGVFSMFSQASTAAGTSTGDVATGRQLFSVSCITCHGANLQGVTNKGPSLLGVGGAATYFQVGTGRMPLVGQGADATRKQSIYSEADVRALAAYVQSIGGGTAIPTGSQRDDAGLAEGGELFRLNCASCHNFAGKGAPLSAGKYAPSLNKATDLQIATAMLSGPENMPVFSDNQLTPTQKHEIISYIQTLKASKDPGGAGLDRVGPVTEGLVIWVVGIGAMMVVILWIGAKS